MKNEELINALRWCSIEDNEYCVDDDYRCPYFVWDKSKDDCKSKMMNASADALEELQQIADHYEQTAKDYWKEACEYKRRITDAPNKWIPCKERLPESNGKYLVTWDGLSGYTYVDILSYGYADDAETNPFWYFYDSEYGECIHDNVIAWMLLPEPYEPKEQSDG